jgi:D-galactose 1-dehydrogenase
MRTHPRRAGPESRIRTALAGLGKIARDQHLPTITASGRLELVAVASPHDRLDGVPSFPDVATLIRETAGLAAIVVCTPPQTRYAIALHALEQGLHVLLEKPPGASVGQVLQLISTAERQGVALLASWHSRHAPGVEPARRWLSGRKVREVGITWREDVRVWHPGQRWLWQPGGLGVFDPGINAISIATRILPGDLVLEDAELDFPLNCATPIAARLRWRGPDHAPVHAEFDFRQSGEPTWDIDVVTDAGRLRLSSGGAVLSIDDRPVILERPAEYAGLYAHFAALVDARRIDADVTPLRHVADAFLSGRRCDVAPFLD